MADTDLRERIKEVAVEHFNANGYHGTTIRNIAKDVNCSLPMIYYYYKNKKEMFDEIIKKDFFNLLEKQASLLKIDNVVDFYTKFIYDLNFLSNYDKQVYRLGIKVYLSFDGDEELMSLMDEWEKSILPRHYQLLKPYIKNVGNEIAVVRTLVHLLETMIENIIVKNRYLPEDEIREEISIVLQGCV
ncbi:MAG TPA: TetR/AcrR family transcriptional regulator [Syntrophomonadaceae bacterium]|nr:TetR/AcrR family transcriptional regulator [Syntrophomonadaceae bacterium]